MRTHCYKSIKPRLKHIILFLITPDLHWQQKFIYCVFNLIQAKFPIRSDIYFNLIICNWMNPGKRYWKINLFTVRVVSLNGSYTLQIPNSLCRLWIKEDYNFYINSLDAGSNGLIRHILEKYASPRRLYSLTQEVKAMCPHGLWLILFIGRGILLWCYPEELCIDLKTIISSLIFLIKALTI